MRERHIFWDIAVVGLLGLLVLFNGVMLLQTNTVEKRLLEQSKYYGEIQSQNREILKKLESGVALQSNPGATAALPGSSNSRNYFAPTDDIVPVTGTLYDGRNLPNWTRGDEKADDGDWLVLNDHSEPNSLNPIIDNDATAADLFDRANDRLCKRAFDDINYWEPRLARAWEKAMLCRGVAAQKNAKELAEKLNKALDAGAKKRLKISRIEAESDEVLRIELADVSGDYRAEVAKILGEGAIQKQHWIYVSFEGDKFSDGAEISARGVGERLQDVISKSPAFKGRFLPLWERESSVVIQVLGDGELAEKVVKDYVASEKNKGEVTDPKSPTGKTIKKVLTYDVTEPYVFEEKPIFYFHLRKDVKWHDGQPFTGKDVVFSFKTIMNPKVEAAFLRNYLQDCESVELVNNDPFTVKFTWKKPYFLAFVYSTEELRILPEHIFKFTNPDEFNKSEKNQTLIGNGPFKLEKWDRKQQFVFTRNEDYYGRKPHFKKIVAKLVKDPTVSLQLMLAGEMDIDGLSKPQAKEKSKDPEFLKRFNMEISVANSFFYLGWNIRRPLFSDVKVRRALTMLVDRQRIIDDIYRGYAVQLSAPTHPESPAYPRDAQRLWVPFDLAGAVKILNQQGWKDTDGDNVLDKDGQPFKFNLLIVSGIPEYESTANLIKNTFAQAGIVVNVSNLEWSVMLQNVERLNFDAMISGWRMDLDDDPYQLWHSSQTGEKASNHCGYINKEVDRLIESGRSEMNDTKRNELFQRAYTIISEEQPYTFLFVSKRTVAYDRRIQNVGYKLPGSDIRRWWVPKEKQKYK